MLVFDDNPDCLFQPSVEGCHRVLLRITQKKYSTMECGVFPCTLDALLEGGQCKCCTFT